MIENVSLDIKYVKNQFPAFKDPLSSKWTFFENAGGSYVPHNVISHLNTFMTSTKVQPYADFDMSAIAGNNMDRATELFAEMINAKKDEIIIGGSTTINMYVLSNALKHLIKAGDEIIVTLLDTQKLQITLKAAKETNGRKSPQTILAQLLPARLVPLLLYDLNLPERIADMTALQLSKLIERLTHWQLTPSGTEGYRTAEVMVGGVDTNELLSRTMMAKSQPGLYFIGECVDVTGWLGGYNFQWAWSSGWVAGQSIKENL